MIKAILFDFDDTLVTSLLTKTLALQQTAKTIYNFDLSSETIRTYWGKPYRELMSILFADVKDDIYTIITKYEQIRRKYPSQLYEDVLETINTLSKNYLLGIVTASPKNLVLSDMQLLNIPINKFFFIQTIEDTPIHKPNPKVFEPILKKLSQKGITKEQTIYVGDSLNDYLAASKAGLKFYALPDRTTQKKEFLKHDIKILKSLNELTDSLT